MILGIGVDSVEINRFAQWNTFSRTQLLRIFSDEEINYCLQNNNNSAERFAARFAAREAFFKALSTSFPTLHIPFLTLCKQISIGKHNNRPFIILKNSNITPLSLTFHLSLTHTNSTATAFVIIEQKD